VAHERDDRPVADRDPAELGLAEEAVNVVRVLLHEREHRLAGRRAVADVDVDVGDASVRGRRHIGPREVQLGVAERGPGRADAHVVLARLAEVRLGLLERRERAGKARLGVLDARHRHEQLRLRLELAGEGTLMIRLGGPQAGLGAVQARRGGLRGGGPALGPLNGSRSLVGQRLGAVAFADRLVELRAGLVDRRLR
jgi:hypothetical protein